MDCPDPGDRGCRFQLFDAPANTLTSATYKPKGKAARLRVAPRWAEFDDKSGDTGWFITQNEKPGPWGGDPRNELVMANQQTSSGVGAGYYGQNDEAFYGWSTFIPVAGLRGDDKDKNKDVYPSPPEPGSPLYDIRHLGTIVLQFHSVGQCDSGGPNLGLKVVRTESDNNEFQKGDKWMWSLYKRDTYADGGEDTADATMLGHVGNIRLWPPRPTTNAHTNLEQGRWHTFVLHVVWSVCDCVPSLTEPCDSPKQRCEQGQNPGKVELWVDGASTRSYPKLGDPENRPTLYRWPHSTAYTSTGPYSSACPNGLVDESTDWADDNSPMPVYLKTGAYRSKEANWTETVFNADLRIGPTKESVDPRLR